MTRHIKNKVIQFRQKKGKTSEEEEKYESLFIL